MGKEPECGAGERQRLHFCQLLQRGLMEERDRRSRRPTVVCCKCGARADAPEDLCQPRPL